MNEFNVIERVLYKKGVFEDLALYVKKFNSVFIVTTEIPKNLYFPSLCGFLNDKEICFSTYVLDEKEQDINNILKIASKASGYDCLISFGAGKVTDIVKLAAKEMSLPYIVVPSTISHFGYFTNYAYKQNQLSMEKTECDFPEKVFIDENIIKKSPENFVASAAAFIFSFEEVYFSELVKSKIFESDKTLELNNLKRIISKTSGLLNWLSLKKEVAVLNLMDNIIELFSLTLNMSDDFPAVEMAVSKSEDNINLNFGRRTLTNASVILSTYLYFWSDEKICYKNIPNIEKSLKILEKNGKNTTFFENFIKNHQNLTNSAFFYKIRMIRLELLIALKKERDFFSKLCQKFMSIYFSTETRFIKSENIFENLTYVSLAKNCFSLNAMMRLGYLNVV